LQNRSDEVRYDFFFRCQFVAFANHTHITFLNNTSPILFYIVYINDKTDIFNRICWNIFFIFFSHFYCYSADNQLKQAKAACKAYCDPPGFDVRYINDTIGTFISTLLTIHNFFLRDASHSHATFYDYVFKHFKQFEILKKLRTCSMLFNKETKIYCTAEKNWIKQLYQNLKLINREYFTISLFSQFTYS
jgi:hypothetical protein